MINLKKFVPQADYRRILSLLAAASMLLPVLIIPVAADAAQLTARSVVVGSSVQSASTTYAITFTPATIAANSVGSIKFEICDSPLQSVGCAAVVASNISTGASFGSSTFTSVVSPSSGLPTTNWSKLSSTGGSTSGTQFILKQATTAQTTTANPVTVNLAVVVNPSNVNTSYYLRISTYTGLDGVTTPVDFGAVALSTAQQISVTAIVQEQLAFTTGQTGSCGSITGTTVDLGILTTATYGNGTSKMCASTNAQSGYAITYFGDTLKSGANSIPVIGGTATALAGVGTASTFGINAKLNTAPAGTSANPSGGSGTASANYNTADSYAYVVNTATQIASSSIATANTLFTVSYVTNILPTQQAGQYTTTLTYVCTGTF